MPRPSLLDLVKSIVKVGIVLLTAPDKGVILGAQEGVTMLLDWFAGRSTPLYERLVRKVEADFRMVAQAKEVNEEELYAPLADLRDILQQRSDIGEELARADFDPYDVALRIWNQSISFHTGLSEQDIQLRIELLQTFFKALVIEQEAMPQFQQAFRHEVLTQFKLARAEIAQLPFELQNFAQQVAAQALYALPTRKWQSDLPPATMLRAEYGIIPFWGRQSEIEDLKQWCEIDKSILLKLYLGAGGIGKTRLFLHFCQLLATLGWRTGFLRLEEDIPRDVLETLFVSKKPLLLVVDYAEHRRTELVSLLSAAAEFAADRRFRLVLLARSTGDWWRLLKGEGSGVGDLIRTGQTVYLGPLAQVGQERITLFNDAVHIFAAKLGKAAVATVPDNLDKKFFERILLIHTAALASIEDVKIKGDSDSLLDFLLDREMKYWSRRVQQLGLPEYLGPALRQAMAVLTLVGGAENSAEARGLIQMIPRLQGESTSIQAAIAELLHECYPGDKWIEPLQPDLLGEYLGDLAFSEDDRLYDLLLGPKAK